jgi:hypothetical protein
LRRQRKESARKAEVRKKRVEGSWTAAWMRIEASFSVMMPPVRPVTGSTQIAARTMSTRVGKVAVKGQI